MQKESPDKKPSKQQKQKWKQPEVKQLQVSVNTAEMTDSTPDGLME